MKYRFIDEILMLQTRDPAAIRVRKTFPVGDDGLSGPLGPDRVPNSLLLELLAMTGGHLLFNRLEGRQLPLLLKVHECRFETFARPGVALEARASLHAVGAAAGGATMAEASGEVVAGDVRVAAARLLFLCVSVPALDPALFGDRV